MHRKYHKKRKSSKSKDTADREVITSNKVQELEELHKKDRKKSKKRSKSEETPLEKPKHRHKKDKRSLSLEADIKQITRKQQSHKDNEKPLHKQNTEEKKKKHHRSHSRKKEKREHSNKKEKHYHNILTNNDKKDKNFTPNNDNNVYYFATLQQPLPKTEQKYEITDIYNHETKTKKHKDRHQKSETNDNTKHENNNNRKHDKSEHRKYKNNDRIAKSKHRKHEEHTTNNVDLGPYEQYFSVDNNEKQRKTRKRHEENKKLADEDIKNYFTRIQMLIDEKLDVLINNKIKESKQLESVDEQKKYKIYKNEIELNKRKYNRHLFEDSDVNVYQKHQPDRITKEALINRNMYNENKQKFEEKQKQQSKRKQTTNEFERDTGIDPNGKLVQSRRNKMSQERKKRKSLSEEGQQVRDRSHGGDDSKQSNVVPSKFTYDKYGKKMYVNDGIIPERLEMEHNRESKTIQRIEADHSKQLKEIQHKVVGKARRRFQQIASTVDSVEIAIQKDLHSKLTGKTPSERHRKNRKAAHPELTPSEVIHDKMQQLQLQEHQRHYKRLPAVRKKSSSQVYLIPQATFSNIEEEDDLIHTANSPLILGDTLGNNTINKSTSSSNSFVVNAIEPPSLERPRGSSQQDRERKRKCTLECKVVSIIGIPSQVVQVVEADTNPSLNFEKYPNKKNENMLGQRQQIEAQANCSSLEFHKDCHYCNEMIENKKKSKRFKLYYRYSIMDDTQNGNISDAKSVLSDSHKRILEQSDHEDAYTCKHSTRTKQQAQILQSKENNIKKPTLSIDAATLTDINNAKPKQNVFETIKKQHNDKIFKIQSEELSMTNKLFIPLTESVKYRHVNSLSSSNSEYSLKIHKKPALSNISSFKQSSELKHNKRILLKLTSNSDIIICEQAESKVYKSKSDVFVGDNFYDQFFAKNNTKSQKLNRQPKQNIATQKQPNTKNSIVSSRTSRKLSKFEREMCSRLFGVDFGEMCDLSLKNIFTDSKLQFPIKKEQKQEQVLNKKCDVATEMSTENLLQKSVNVEPHMCDFGIEVNTVDNCHKDIGVATAPEMPAVNKVLCRNCCTRNKTTTKLIRKRSIPKTVITSSTGKPHISNSLASPRQKGFKKPIHAPIVKRPQSPQIYVPQFIKTNQPKHDIISTKPVTTENANLRGAESHYYQEQTSRDSSNRVNDSIKVIAEKRGSFDSAVSEECNIDNMQHISLTEFQPRTVSDVIEEMTSENSDSKEVHSSKKVENCKKVQDPSKISAKLATESNKLIRSQSLVEIGSRKLCICATPHKSEISFHEIVVSSREKTRISTLIQLDRFGSKSKAHSLSKSNAYSLDQYADSVMSSRPQSSRLFLTKTYRGNEISSYQKRKMYDEKIRRKMRYKNFPTHNDNLSQQIYEVRYLTMSSNEEEEKSSKDTSEPSKNDLTPMIQETCKNNFIKKLGEPDHAQCEQIVQDILQSNIDVDKQKLIGIFSNIKRFDELLGNCDVFEILENFCKTVVSYQDVKYEDTSSSNNENQILQEVFSKPKKQEFTINEKTKRQIRVESKTNVIPVEARLSCPDLTSCASSFDFLYESISHESLTNNNNTSIKPSNLPIIMEDLTKMDHNRIDTSPYVNQFNVQEEVSIRTRPASEESGYSSTFNNQTQKITDLDIKKGLEKSLGCEKNLNLIMNLDVIPDDFKEFNLLGIEEREFNERMYPYSDYYKNYENGVVITGNVDCHVENNHLDVVEKSISIDQDRSSQYTPVSKTSSITSFNSSPRDYNDTELEIRSNLDQSSPLQLRVIKETSSTVSCQIIMSNEALHTESITYLASDKISDIFYNADADDNKLSLISYTNEKNSDYLLKLNDASKMKQLMAQKFFANLLAVYEREMEISKRLAEDQQFFECSLMKSVLDLRRSNSFSNRLRFGNWFKKKKNIDCMEVMEKKPLEDETDEYQSRLQSLAYNARRYFTMLVQAVKINQSINDEIKMCGLLKLLERIEKGDFRVLRREHEVNFEEEIKEQMKQAFLSVYKITSAEAKKYKRKLTNDDINLIRIFVSKYRIGLLSKTDIIASYIGKGLIDNETRLKAAITYLMRCQAPDVIMCEFEEFCGFTKNCKRIK